MIKSKPLILALVALLPFSVLAEDDAPEKSLFVGATLTDGNSETESVTAELKLGKKTDASEILLDVDFAYGEADDVKNVDKGSASLQFNPFIGDNLYGYGKGDIGYDDIAGVDYRATVGVGLGTYLIKSEAHELAVEAGPTYVWEKVGGVGPSPTDPTMTISLPGVENDYLALRFAERSSHKLSDTAKVYQSVEYLPEAEDFDSYLLNAEAGVESALTEKLSLRISVKNAHDSTPAAGRDENDLTVSAGLVLGL